MKCTVFRAPARPYTYLFVREDFEPDDLPTELVERFDFDDPVMALELGPDRPLAQENVEVVIAHLEDPGYHLQLPPEDDPSGWLELPPKKT